MDVFVTGGSGFLGRHLLTMLTDRGHSVRALARTSTAAETVARHGATAVLGGLDEHAALIEAMASGGVVLAHDTPENREVGGDAVGYFTLRPAETLGGRLREWLADARTRERYRTRARKRAGERYSWDRVTDAYERLFASL